MEAEKNTGDRKNLVNITTYINELMSQTTVVQYFKNTLAKPVELEMIIPRISDINLTRFEMIKNNQKVVSILLEKEKAKEKYTDKISSGDSAFISYNTESETKVCLGNIPAGEEIELKTFFFGHIVNKDLSYQAKFPVIFPQFSLEDSKTGEDIDYEYEKLTIKGKIYIHTNSKLTRLVISGSNNFDKIEKKYGEDKKSAEIDIFKNNFSVKDIPGIILFRTEKINDDILYYQYDSKKNKSYYMLQKTLFIPELNNEIKNEVDENEKINYTSLIKPETIEPSKLPKICYIFLLDQSGSMSGQRIDLSCKALLLFLQSLNINCYFQLIGFGSDYGKYSDEPLEYNKENIKNLMEKIKKLKADRGGTELYKPLNDIYNNKIYEKYDMKKEIILLTDGELFDKEQVINLIGSKSDKFIFNSIGIGSCDKDLIERTALMGKGYSNYIKDLNELNSVVISVLDKTNIPLNINCTTNQKTIIEDKNKKILDRYAFFKHGFILDEKEIKDIEFIIKNDKNEENKISFEKNKITKLPEGDKLGKLIVDNYLKSDMCKERNTRIKLSKEYNILTDETAFFAEMTNEEAPKDKMVLITNKDKVAKNNKIEENKIIEEYVFEDEQLGYDNNDSNAIQEEEEENQKKGFLKGIFNKIFSKNSDKIIKKKYIEYKPKKPKKEFHFPKFNLPFGKKYREAIMMRAQADYDSCKPNDDKGAYYEDNYDCCYMMDYSIKYKDDDKDDDYYFDDYKVNNKKNIIIEDKNIIKEEKNIIKVENNKVNNNIIQEDKKEIKFNFDELILAQDIIEGNWTKDTQVEILISQEKDIFEKIKKIAENKNIHDENGIITVFVLYYIFENKKEKIKELKFVINKAKTFVKRIFNLEYDDIIKEI